MLMSSCNAIGATWLQNEKKIFQHLPKCNILYLYTSLIVVNVKSALYLSAFVNWSLLFAIRVVIIIKIKFYRYFIFHLTRMNIKQFSNLCCVPVRGLKI